MQTKLTLELKKPAERETLEAILRACVHCGFCSATCPTYQLLGDELDSPRGRIYQLKQMLEGQPVSRLTQQHLDRCLSCRSCETTCPSGVHYSRLLDAGREVLEAKVRRPLRQRLLRAAMKLVFPYRKRFAAIMLLARGFRPLLPGVLKNKIPVKKNRRIHKAVTHQRKMLILPGCVQQSLAPEIDEACQRVLAFLSISLVTIDQAACCGALNYHLSDHRQALAFARHTIDSCWPDIVSGAEAIVSTASGCGVMYKDYGYLLKDEPDYAEKAEKFSSLVKDISEILALEDLSAFDARGKTVAFQTPCTLQHGQKLSGKVEAILSKTGFRIIPLADNHLCCGSAGVYSLLEPILANRLRANKIAALKATNAEYWVTANIGCQSHLQVESDKAITHWIELLNELV